MDGRAAAAEGMALLARGRFAEAAAAFASAARLLPHDADIAFALGVAWIQAGRPAEAAEAWRGTLRLAPAHPAAGYNLARALTELGDWGGAEAAYRAHLAHRPDDADAHYNLANLLYRRGERAGAIAAHDAALALRPDHGPGLVNRALALDASGRPAEAEADFRRALALDPRSVDAHWNLSLLLMKQGRWAEGLAEYEWRRMLPGAPQAPWGLSEWSGTEPAGTRVLVWNDQGIGDALMFLRHLPALAARGAVPLLVVQDPLAQLAAAVPGAAGASGFSDPPPAADAHLPLSSLPLRLGVTDPLAWPGQPWLAPVSRPPATVERPAVGLMWSGNPGTDDARHVPVGALAPLLAVPGITFYSLQVGAAAADCPPGVNDLSPLLVDFAATAAVLAEIDLVVTVDTAVAHLAGAMGRPAWVMLQRLADWRWSGGETTPAYPSLRLFRQEDLGQWDGVVAAISRALAARFAAFRQ
ncbi:MAG: tetratricopeptide repeat protein [Actinomycetota bacterium]